MVEIHPYDDYECQKYGQASPLISTKVDAPLPPPFSLLDVASLELEGLRANHQRFQAYFPNACLAQLFQIKGNGMCVDCGRANPLWSSVSFGCLLCSGCAENHRKMGAKVSFVRSLDMDRWSHLQILSMLEGGNEQLQDFFSMNRLTKNTSKESDGRTAENVSVLRYKTKAAQFYKDALRRHVVTVWESGPYRGREAARKQQRKKIKSRPRRGAKTGEDEKR